MKFDLGFGNAVCVREALLNLLDARTTEPGVDLSNMDYPPEFGNHELIRLTRKIILRQTGNSYKHIFLTNGATGGVTIALRSYAAHKYKHVVVRDPPLYSRYPGMIKAAGLDMSYEKDGQNKNSITLLDYPSNPRGLLTPISDNGPVVFDAVYFNNVYMPFSIPYPTHDILVGSYSKLLGCHGFRVGWIALDDDIMANTISELVVSEYSGLSSVDSQILIKIIKATNWDRFEKDARKNLDNNRTEWSKLERFMPEYEVKTIGMFHFSRIDSLFKKLLEKSNIIWTPGSAMGVTDNFCRFNIGQKQSLVSEAVKEILKNDKIKNR